MGNKLIIVQTSRQVGVREGVRFLLSEVPLYHLSLLAHMYHTNLHAPQTLSTHGVIGIGEK